MKYFDRALDYLEQQADWRYMPHSSPAAEPTAFAALALGAYERIGAAAQARAWLSTAQLKDGSVPVRFGEDGPGWPTALAVLAWNLARPRESADSAAAQRALAWLLATGGETSPPQKYTGHDTRLRGWPWVIGTHSWVEPTAMSVLALRSAGLNDHPRTREALRMLTDRLLTTGGANYGNTVVLGQTLLPHIEPTGAVLLALAGEEDHSSGRIEAALRYLSDTLDATTAPASLSYGLLGLAAFDRTPAEADALIAAAIPRSIRRGATLEVALLTLAALGAESPLVQVSRATRNLNVVGNRS